MTLRRLAIGAQNPLRIDPTQSRTAIAFALDGAYLTPFHVMVHSMLRSGSLLDSPVYIYSDDPLVFQDPLVALVADRTIPIEGHDLEQLVGVAERNIQRPERAKWNRGTCLKWMVFDDAPVDQILFLDVDMLCLRPINGFVRLHPRRDLVTCGQFQRQMMPDPGSPNAREEARDRLLEMISRPSNFGRRINSGVMLVRKRLLSRAFRDKLIAFASSRVEINEQSILTGFFREEGPKQRVRRALAPSAYNFQENYLDTTDPVDSLKILQKIRILHYAGTTKPWDAKAAKKHRYSLQLWRQFHLSAKEAQAEIV